MWDTGVGAGRLTRIPARALPARATMVKMPLARALTCDQSSFGETLVQIEDVSRNTTVQSILNIVGLRLSRLGFTERTLRMAYISPTSSKPQATINPCQVHVYST